MSIPVLNKKKSYTTFLFEYVFTMPEFFLYQISSIGVMLDVYLGDHVFFDSQLT